MFSTENMDCILNVFLLRQFHVINVIYVFNTSENYIFWCLSAYLQNSNLLVKYMRLSVILVIVKEEYEKCFKLFMLQPVITMQKSYMF